jgi:hypothetical protein
MSTTVDEKWARLVVMGMTLGAIRMVEVMLEDAAYLIAQGDDKDVADTLKLACDWCETARRSYSDAAEAIASKIERGA